MFREEGFDGAGIDAIMKAAGLTRGGFYCHFESKEDLAVEAVISALKRGVEKQSRYETLGDHVSAYLSKQHCTNRANGCKAPCSRTNRRLCRHSIRLGCARLAAPPPCARFHHEGEPLVVGRAPPAAVASDREKNSML
jgi:AcrR family transcriptional regulator